MHDTDLNHIINPQIKLVNINASDVVDGKSAVVLGLIWTIILYFQVHQSHRIFNHSNQNLIITHYKLPCINTLKEVNFLSVERVIINTTLHALLSSLFRMLLYLN